MSITKTSRFRLYVVISLIWSLVAMSGYRVDLGEFIGRTIPIWVFWASVWIWPEKLQWAFGVGDKLKRKKELNEWVYLDKETAQKSELYGVGGWAIVFIIAAVIPVALNIAILTDSINFSIIDGSTYSEEHLGYGLYDLVSNVLSWTFVTLTLLSVYLLLKHNKVFQKFFIVLFFIGLTSDIVLFIWMINILNYSDNDALQAAIAFKAYIVGVIWLFYVLKSKRINLTTRKRIKRRYLSYYFPNYRSNNEKKYEDIPSS